MKFPGLLQLRKEPCLFWRGKDGDGRGKFGVLAVRPFLLHVVIRAAAGCGGDDFNILQFGGNQGLPCFAHITGNQRNNVAPFQLAGQPCGKGFDGDGNRPLRTVQLRQIFIFKLGCVGQLALQHIVAFVKVCIGVLANHILGLVNDVSGKVIAAHLHGGEHFRRDFIALFDFRADAHNLHLGFQGVVEHGRQSKADDKRHHNADQPHHDTVLQ